MVTLYHKVDYQQQYSSGKYDYNIRKKYVASFAAIWAAVSFYIPFNKAEPAELLYFVDDVKIYLTAGIMFEEVFLRFFPLTCNVTEDYTQFEQKIQRYGQRYLRDDVGGRDHSSYYKDTE